MVCGASGTGTYSLRRITSNAELTSFFCTGRTTFVNTLCGKQVLEGKDADDAANAHIEEGVHIKPVTVGKLALPLLSSTRPTNVQ